jgi:tellurite resistance protein TerB
MGFKNVKDWLNQQKTSVQESLTRFKNKEFLEAVVAGCALVAAADGTIDDSEKETMAGFIQRNDALKVFDMSQVIASFNKFIGNFEFNVLVGKAEAFRAIHKIKTNEEAARLLIRVCCAIGMADGDFNSTEKAVVREICLELGLNPNEFGLESANSSDQTVKHQIGANPAGSNQQTVKRQDLLDRFKNRDFLEAIVAGCALVSAADGKIEAREKEAMARFLQMNDAVKVFDSQEVLAKFDKFTTNFNFSPVIGHAEARKAIQKLGSDKEAARTLIKLCCDIGQADGQFTQEEKKVVRGMCTDLALDPSEFGL